MSKSDLAAKYGTSKSLNQLVNAAIRAEITGGNAALDALAQLRNGGNPHRPCADQVRRIVDAMGDEIRRRYGLPPIDNSPAKSPGDDPNRVC
jgi:hypothetical protein